MPCYKNQHRRLLGTRKEITITLDRKNLSATLRSGPTMSTYHANSNFAEIEFHCLYW
jgi:hypothetical protein